MAYSRSWEGCQILKFNCTSYLVIEVRFVVQVDFFSAIQVYPFDINIGVIKKKNGVSIRSLQIKIQIKIAEAACFYPLDMY